jgi:two-component system cell cycle response regulator
MEPELKIIRILLIEDDEDDYHILRDCLMEQDNHSAFEMDWVETYQAGLKDIERADHDIYLIDHYLGAYSGLDLLKEAVQAGCQAPLIIVTGQSDREIDQAALMAGAMDYLVKGQLDGKLLERSIRYALERSRLLKKIRELAVRDALTGLYNRRELHRFLEYEIIKSRRYNHAFSLLLMDIDHFKEINDRFGHRVGDEILQQVAHLMLNQTRGCDLPARYGGDEFIIVLPETPAPQGLIGAERLRKVVENVFIQVANEGGEIERIEITVSIGVAGYPGDAEAGEQLIDLADQALYQAKHTGCNQVVRYVTGQEKEWGSK